MYLIAISIFTYDIWFYISHVLLHSKYLYLYHSIHHSNPEPTYLDTYVEHPIESPLQGIGMFLPMFIYTYTWYEIGITLFLLNIRGMMRHDERFIFLIGNHHLLHHKYPGYNFGEYWIDSLFGTRYPNEEEYRYGLIYV